MVYLVFASSLSSSRLDGYGSWSPSFACRSHFPGRGAWYRRWLERALRVLHNERLIPRLRVGLTRADVLAEVSGDWKTRPALGRPVRYFEAEDIPAQLVLDEQDLVVEVTPWPFISARP